MVKFDKDGRFLEQVGSEKAGNGPNEYNLPHGLQVDPQGNVYVADRANNRYQVLDNNLKPKVEKGVRLAHSQRRRRLIQDAGSSTRTR